MNTLRRLAPAFSLVIDLLIWALAVWIVFTGSPDPWPFALAGAALTAVITERNSNGLTLLIVLAAGTAFILTGGFPEPMLWGLAAGWVVLTPGRFLAFVWRKRMLEAQLEAYVAAGVSPDEARDTQGFEPLRVSEEILNPQPRPSRKIVAFSGYAGAGKDTAAEALLENGWTRVSFADKLRAFLYAQNPWVRMPDTFVGEFGFMRLRDVVDRHGWQTAKELVGDIRELQQRTGTEAGRKTLYEDVWVDAVMSDLPEGNIVVTDCRFPNEAAAVKAAGGQVVRVARPGTEPVNAHPSETALDGYAFDRVLVNDGDVDDLHAEVFATFCDES